MQECYHKKCDSSAMNSTINFADLSALSKVAQTVIDAVVDASGAKCVGSNRRIARMDQEDVDDTYVLDYTSVADKR